MKTQTTLSKITFTFEVGTDEIYISFQPLKRVEISGQVGPGYFVRIERRSDNWFKELETRGTATKTYAKRLIEKYVQS